jgi:hypothetical protein
MAWLRWHKPHAEYDDWLESINRAGLGIEELERPRAFHLGDEFEIDWFGSLSVSGTLELPKHSLRQRCGWRFRVAHIRAWWLGAPRVEFRESALRLHWTSQFCIHRCATWDALVDFRQGLLSLLFTSHALGMGARELWGMGWAWLGRTRMA